MYKKVFSFILFGLLFLWSVPAMAEDLPIDITTIGQMDAEHRRDAVTPRHGVDLFSESAEEVDVALANQSHQLRASAADGLFGEIYSMCEFNIEQRIILVAEESDLFATPMQFRRNDSSDETSGAPIFLILFILLLCTIGGFVSAKITLRRKVQKSNVPNGNNKDN